MSYIDKLIHRAVRRMMRQRNVSFTEACRIVYTRLDVRQSREKASAL